MSRRNFDKSRSACHRPSSFAHGIDDCKHLTGAFLLRPQLLTDSAFNTPFVNHWRSRCCVPQGAALIPLITHDVGALFSLHNPNAEIVYIHY